ncbi:MAG: hypothetical protein AB7O04_03980 [Hyphomonadaceae bacterium]
MPSDTLTVTLPAALADDLRTAAAARGLTPEEYVRQQLAYDMALGNDSALLSEGAEEDLAAIEEFERTGEAIPAEEVFAWLQSLHTENPLPRPKPHKIR